MDCADHRDRSHARQRGFAMVDPAGVGTSSLVGRHRDAVSISACYHAARAEAIHLLPVLITELCATLPVWLASVSSELALEIWKWRLTWTFSISSRPVGNQFQQLLGNEESGIIPLIYRESRRRQSGAVAVCSRSRQDRASLAWAEGGPIEREKPWGQATCSSATRTLPLVSGLSSSEMTTLIAATTVPTSIGMAYPRLKFTAK